ncbi:hypothetical protein Ahy_A08g039921 [Arachis hypogaea]|uniref:Uncharacterized protein n=1 Tax=Arachis hypogaea TaxID=3818 RepID=A0A445BXQ6_ARAHY|nr:hypothetical protein Ahy_A08g039921 [Arachis hypogaea]
MSEGGDEVGDDGTKRKGFFSIIFVFNVSGQLSSDSSNVEVKKKEYEGLQRGIEGQIKELKEWFAARMKDIELKERQIEERMKKLDSKEKQFEGQLEEVESIRKKYESKLNEILFKEKQVEAQLKELEDPMDSHDKKGDQAMAIDDSHIFLLEQLMKISPDIESHDDRPLAPLPIHVAIPEHEAEEGEEESDEDYVAESRDSESSDGDDDDEFLPETPAGAVPRHVLPPLHPIPALSAVPSHYHTLDLDANEGAPDCWTCRSSDTLRSVT